MDNCGTKKIVESSNANKSYQLQYCKQKLSLATCAHKSYRSFDAILRFFLQFWGFEPKDLTLRTNAQYKVIEHLNVLKISPKSEA